MSAELSGLFVALGILAFGFVGIGPNILAIIGTAMESGRECGTKLAFGVGLGSGIWASLTVLGLTSLITAYAGIVFFLKIFGACYLLWLAYKAFRSAVSSSDSFNIRAEAGRNLFAQGILIQMTNPKAALHWIAIVGLGLGNDAPLWVGASLIVFATVISIFGHVTYAILFSSPPVVSVYQRFRRWIEGTLGVFFVFAAFKVATHKS